MKWSEAIVLGLFLLLSCPAAAAEVPLWEFGLRGGMDATGVEENYKAGEIYLLRTLPWRSELAGGVLGARLDLGAGYLESGGDSGGWLAAGGDLVYSLAERMVDLEAGIRPTWLIDNEFGNDDYGGGFQFSSHVGVSVYIDPVVVGYRYQHISNAGIYGDNDGLNLHLFGLGVRY